MRTGELAKNGSMAAATPCATQKRHHENAAFIEENEIGAQAVGFFLMRGHSAQIQF